MTGSSPLEPTRREPAPPDGPIVLLDAVADPVRWTVLRRLGLGTACVCELQEHVAVAPSLLSYHLKVLRDAGLVTTRRRGRWVDYTLDPHAYERLLAALPLPGREVTGTAREEVPA